MYILGVFNEYTEARSEQFVAYIDRAKILIF